MGQEKIIIPISRRTYFTDNSRIIIYYQYMSSILFANKLIKIDKLKIKLKNNTKTHKQKMKNKKHLNNY